MAVVDSVVPLAVWLTWPWNMIAMLPIGIGGLLIWTSIVYLRLRHTTAEPFENPTALVSDGRFRYSRNPVYLGAALLLSGFALACGSLTPWMILAAYVFAITRYIIRAEEQVMVNHFGEQYERYRSTVRTWL